MIHLGYHHSADSFRSKAPKLPVRENDAGQVFVANLTSLPIESVAEFDKIYK